MRRIFRLFRQRKGAFFMTLFCCVGGVVITILWNSGLAVIIDGVQEGHGPDAVWMRSCVVLVVLGAILQGGMQFFAAYAGEYAAHDLRLSLAQTMKKKDYSVIVKESAGELISSQHNEMEEINQYISDNFFTLCSTAINFIFTLVFLATQNAILTLLYLAPVVGLAVYTTVSNKVIYRYTKQEQEQVKKMNGMTGTLLTLFPVLRIYEAEKLLQERFRESVARWQKSVIAEERMKARLMSLSGILSGIPLTLLLLVGGTMVMQAPCLLPMSIRDNITCGHSMTEETVWGAVRAAQLEEWISRLPEGLDSLVGERGGNISGGQAQRIAIARAFAKNAPVVLLDEPTSALDEKTSAALLRAMERLTEGKTVIHVTHREETLLHCDRILELKGGKLFDREHTERMTVYLSAIAECADTVLLYDAGELLLERYRENSLRIVKARLQINLRKALGELLQLLLGRGGYLLRF